VNVARARALSSIPLLIACCRGAGRSSIPLNSCGEAGLDYTIGVFLLASFVLGAIVGVVLWMVFKIFALSLVLGAAAACLPLLVVRHKRTKRLETFEEQFPEAIDLIARAMRAGHALTTGLGMVADEIPPPVGQEFRRLYDEQNFGMSLPEAMRAMARRVPVLDARFFVTAVPDAARGRRQSVRSSRQPRVGDAGAFQVKAASACRVGSWPAQRLDPVVHAAGACRDSLHARNFMSVLWEDPSGLQLLLAAGCCSNRSVIIARMVRIEY
jgi:tight adherence protein B